MSLTIKYENVAGTLSSIGSNVIRFGSLALTQSADIGDAAMSEVDWDDDSGAWVLKGYRVFSMTESAAPSNNQQVYRGRLMGRTISRGPSERTTVARRIHVEIADQNVLLGWRVMKDENANRPAETAGDRIRWLVNTRRAPIFAHPTYFANPTTAMDAADYRNQRYNDVLADIANVTGYNFWADYDEGRERTELFFIDPGSSSYVSTLSISNVLSEVNSSTVFAPSEDAEQGWDPERVAASVLGVYENGDVYTTRDSTGNAFAYVDQTYELSNIKTAAKALALNTRYLDDNDEEDEHVTCSIIVPAASVNAIRHGQLVQCKFTHFDGPVATSPTYYRVQKRTVVQEDAIGQNYYRIALDLSPTGSSVIPVAGPDFSVTVCNSVVEDATREGSTFTTGALVQPNQTWTYRITNTSHDIRSITEKLYIVTNPTANAYAFEVPVPLTSEQGTGTPYSVMAAKSGAFTTASSVIPGSEFLLRGFSNYGTGGAATTDECWLFELWRNT